MATTEMNSKRPAHYATYWAIASIVIVALIILYSMRTRTSDTTSPNQTTAASQD